MIQQIYLIGPYVNGLPEKLRIDAMQGSKTDSIMLEHSISPPHFIWNPTRAGSPGRVSMPSRSKRFSNEPHSSFRYLTLGFLPGQNSSHFPRASQQLVGLAGSPLCSLQCRKWYGLGCLRLGACSSRNRSILHLEEACYVVSTDYPKLSVICSPTLIYRSLSLRRLPQMLCSTDPYSYQTRSS
jgi:hypothetical protein